MSVLLSCLESSDVDRNPRPTVSTPFLCSAIRASELFTIHELFQSVVKQMMADPCRGLRDDFLFFKHASGCWPLKLQDDFKPSFGAWEREPTFQASELICESGDKSAHECSSKKTARC